MLVWVKHVHVVLGHHVQEPVPAHGRNYNLVTEGRQTFLNSNQFYNQKGDNSMPPPPLSSKSVEGKI